jgi:peptidoglycan L-alanyl-D-glutamate endopeptidase CwlK
VNRDPAELDPDVRELWLLLCKACEERHVYIFLTGTYRTPAEQDALYAQGRTTPGRKVTNARGGWSWHQWRRAFDVAIRDYPGDPTPDDVYDGPWALVGALGEHLGLEWGGHWPHGADLPHFQSTKGLTLTQMNARGVVA